MPYGRSNKSIQDNAFKKQSGFKMAGMKFGEGTGSMLNKDKEGVVEVDAKEMDMLNNMNTGVKPNLSKAIIDEMNKGEDAVFNKYAKHKK